jgi:hypothetical protein
MATAIVYLLIKVKKSDSDKFGCFGVHFVSSDTRLYVVKSITSVDSLNLNRKNSTMAKNVAAVKHVKVPKAKTAAQQAKAAANIAEAARRLERLQEKQSLARELRSRGYKGRSDNEVIDQFNKEQEVNSAASYVEKVLAVPVAGQIILRWLKDRVNQNPIHVRSLIVNFLNRDGSIEGHRDNAKLRNMVDDYLYSEQGQAILRHLIAA